MLRGITPPLAIVEEKVEKKDQWYVDLYYEPSDIIQGNRTGHWNEITTMFGYIHRNLRGYLSISQLERFDDKDQTANIGAYYSFKDCYFHEEIGFGWNTSYIYKLQNIAEYGHRLVDNVFWQVGYSYRAYPTDDSHTIYPGLIYYFGDNYISADYGFTAIEGRGNGSFGTIKGNFIITQFLQLYGGLAFGQWLYDIYGIDSNKSQGYVLFTGLKINIYKGIDARFGYAYGTEEPKFIKRSLTFAMSVKF